MILKVSTATVTVGLKAVARLS